MTSPYRSSAEPLVVCQPKRTLLGRLRSWWRVRIIRRRGRWRERWVRHRCGHASRHGDPRETYVLDLRRWCPACFEVQRYALGMGRPFRRFEDLSGEDLDRVGRFLDVGRRGQSDGQYAARVWRRLTRGWPNPPLGPFVRVVADSDGGGFPNPPPPKAVSE